MIRDDLFTSLYRYRLVGNMTPTENYFTECLAYVLNNDRALLGKFVEWVAPGRNFKAGDVETQKPISSSSIVDLVVKESGKGGRRILVEIKIRSRENRYFESGGAPTTGQVEKYLINSGTRDLVAFISFRDETPVTQRNKKRYLGAFEWRSFHQILRKHISGIGHRSYAKMLCLNLYRLMNKLGIGSSDALSENDAKTNIARSAFKIYKLEKILADLIKGDSFQKACKAAHLRTRKVELNLGPPCGVVGTAMSWKNKWQCFVYHGYFFMNSVKDFEEDEWSKAITPKKKGVYYFFEVNVSKKKSAEIYKKMGGGRSFIKSKLFPHQLLDDDIMLASYTYLPDLLKKSKDGDITEHVLGLIRELVRTKALEKLSKM